MSKAKPRIQQQEGICHGNTLLMQGQTLLTVSHFLPPSALLIGRQAVVFVVFSSAVAHTARDSAEINFAQDPEMIRSCSSVQSLSAAGEPVSCVYFSLSATAGNPAHQQAASFPPAAVSKVTNILSVSPWPRLHYSLQRRWFVNGTWRNKNLSATVVASADSTVTNRYAFTS